jgi:hypothetical protein
MKSATEQIADDLKKLGDIRKQAGIDIQRISALKGLGATSVEMRKLGLEAEATAGRFAKLGSVGKNVLAGLGFGVGAFSVVQITRGLTNLIITTINTRDEIAKLSDTLGVSTEFLSTYGFAAKEADADFGLFRTGLKQFISLIGNANSGSKDAIELFKDFGITQAELKSLNIEALFKRTAESIASITNERERATVAEQVFGKNVLDILPIIIQNYEEAARKASAFGKVISQEQADAAKKASDDLKNLNSTLSLLGTTFAEVVTPPITRAAELIRKSVVGWRLLINALQGDTAETKLV